MPAVHHGGISHEWYLIVVSFAGLLYERFISSRADLEQEKLQLRTDILTVKTNIHFIYTEPWI